MNDTALTEAPKTLLEVDVTGDVDLMDVLHNLAQPLTSLSFLLDLACLQPEPDAWFRSLVSAREECGRAMAAFLQLRAAALAGGLLQTESCSNTLGGQTP